MPQDDLYSSYEEDYKSIVAGVRSKLDTDVKDQKGDAKKASLRRIDMDLDEADEIVSQMEVEVQGMPQSVRTQFQSRVRSSKSDLDALKRQVRTLLSTSDRADLLSRSGGALSPHDEPYSDDGGASDVRTRLLAGNERLQEGSRRLQDSHRTALETEDVGAEILGNLRRQREQIEGTRDTLNNADGSIDRASGTLKKMIRRANQQKLVTGAIILVLVLLILIVLYEKFVA